MNALVARTRARIASGERGMTVVEMAVVMLILSIVLVATATLAIGFTRTNAENVSRQDQIDVARSAVERMSRVTRTAVKPSQLASTCTACTADAFMEAKPLSVKFYANIDNPKNSVGPSRVTYSVASSGPDAGVLIETLQTPDSKTPGSTGYVYCPATSPSASTECKNRLHTRRLAEGVSTSAAVFTYYDTDGNQLVPPSSGLSATALEQILSMELTVTVQSTNPVKPNPTTYIQRITLPNAQAIIRQGEEES